WKALHAGVDAGANGIDVGPRTHRRVTPVHLGRCETGCVHGPDEVSLLRQDFACRAKVDHYRLVVVGNEDVGRLDIEMQHLVLVHDAQAAQHLVKQRADGGFAKHLLRLEVARGDDEVLKGGALQVVHHHVDGFVLTKEIENAHHG